MLRQFFGKFIVSVIAFVCCVGVRAQQPSANGSCHLNVEAKLPLTEINNHFAVPVGFNGETRLLVVDTSAERTLLDASAAEALNLPRDVAHLDHVVGLGENVEADNPRLVSSLTLGPANWINLAIPTAKLNFPQRMGSATPIGILGANVLSRYDVELDFPAKTMTLYTASGCLGHFAPWSGDYQAFSPEYTSRHRFILTLGLDGHRMRAMIDTGTPNTLLSRAAASTAGAGNLSRDSAGSATGIGDTRLGLHIHRFGQMQLGDRAFDNVRVGIIDAPMSTDMLLGLDFLKWRRVWLSYSTGWVFMQRASGGNDIAPLAATSVPSRQLPLDVGGQLSAIARQDSASDTLPADRLREFSTHSHMTYGTMPRVVQVPRLSPEAHAPQNFVPLH